MADLFIANQILEVRLARRNPSFIDIKGTLLQGILEKLKFDKFSIKGDRVEVANEDNTLVYFISWMNFGLQIEGSNSFNDFKLKVEELKTLISDSEYKVNELIRVGTKSTILFHKSNFNYDELKKKYLEKFISKSQILENITKRTINDIGFAFDISDDWGKANITTGQVTKDEALKKHFRDNKIYSDKYSKKAGVFFQIDYFQDNKSKLSSDNWINISKKNIDSIEEIFYKFIEFLIK